MGGFLEECMSQKLTLEIKGKKVEGYAQVIQGKLWVHVAGLKIARPDVNDERLRANHRKI
jgi:lipoate-protein ligase A